MTVSVETFISRVNLFVNARKLKINMCALSAIRFHAYPCNHGHAKTQTADRADHVERALFAAEF